MPSSGMMACRGHRGTTWKGTVKIAHCMVLWGMNRTTPSGNGNATLRERVCFHPLPILVNPVDLCVLLHITYYMPRTLYAHLCGHKRALYVPIPFGIQSTSRFVSSNGCFSGSVHAQSSPPGWRNPKRTSDQSVYKCYVSSVHHSATYSPFFHLERADHTATSNEDSGSISRTQQCVLLLTP